MIEKYSYKNKNVINYVTACLLILINLIIKGIYLDRNSLGGDEPFSVYYSQFEPVNLIKFLLTDNNPPLYELTLHYWVKLFGNSELSVRFPSLIFSSVTVFFIYKIGIRFYNLRVAICSSIILIFSDYHILFAHLARVYAMFGMLSIISVYLFLKIIHTTNKMSDDEFISFDKPILIDSCILTLVNLLLIYAHYFGFFVLFTEIVFICIHHSLLKKLWRILLASMCITFLFFLPILPSVLSRFFITQHNGTWLKPPNGIESIYNMFWGFSNQPVLTVINLILLLVAALTYFYSTNKSVSTTSKFMILLFGLIFVLMFAMSYKLPMFLNRYLMPVALAFCLLIGIAVDYLVNLSVKMIWIPILVCCAYIATVNLNPANTRNVRGVVNRVNELRSDNSLVLICPREFILDYTYYQNNDLFRQGVNSMNLDSLNVLLIKNNSDGICNINQVNLDGRNEIIYIDAAADFNCPSNEIFSTLKKNYKIDKQINMDGVFNITKFRK